MSRSRINQHSCAAAVDLTVHEKQLILIVHSDTADVACRLSRNALLLWH